MKTLLLLRHGKSAWDDAGLDDFDRPLAPRGIKALPVMANVLDALPEVPGRIYASPARRALETARGVARKMKNPPPIEEHPPLYLAENSPLSSRISQLSGERVPDRQLRGR